MATGQEGNISFKQIRAAHRYGDGTQAQSSDGTGASGNLSKFATDGTLTDGAIAASDVGLISKIQQEGYTYAADAGAANAYAVTLSPAPTIVAGSEVVFKAANANTGASTLAVNGGTAADIKKQGSTALANGDIAAGQIVAVVYDGTNWQLIGGGSSAAASYVLIGFNIGSGAVATKVGGYAIAPRTATISTCKIVINASDGATALTFTIKQNGVSVFTSNPTIAAGTPSGTLSTSTSLTSVPLTATADDLFQLDITSGSSAWSFTAQLET